MRKINLSDFQIAKSETARDINRRIILNLIRTRKTPTGRQIIGVSDRPIGFLEAYAGSRSKDYQVGIVVIDLKRNKKGKEVGEGMLIYASKVKIENGKLDIEYVGMEPIRLASVRKN